MKWAWLGMSLYTLGVTCWLFVQGDGWWIATLIECGVYLFAMRNTAIGDARREELARKMREYEAMK